MWWIVCLRWNNFASFLSFQQMWSIILWMESSFVVFFLFSTVLLIILRLELTLVVSLKFFFFSTAVIEINFSFSFQQLWLIILWIKSNLAFLFNTLFILWMESTVLVFLTDVHGSPVWCPSLWSIILLLFFSTFQQLWSIILRASFMARVEEQLEGKVGNFYNMTASQ